MTYKEKGKWIVIEGRIVGDEVTARIEQLILAYLKKVATDQSGWGVLYRDPIDGRYWELSYPMGSTQGGGPPRLAVLAAEQAKRKYNIS
jgi:Immunity protein 27